MLKVCRIPIDTFGENVVYLSDLCQTYRVDAFKGAKVILIDEY